MKGSVTMPVLQPQPKLITLEQYEAYPENKRIEVFDGIVYDIAAPSQEHQTILTELLINIRKLYYYKMLEFVNIGL